MKNYFVQAQANCLPVLEICSRFGPPDFSNVERPISFALLHIIGTRVGINEVAEFAT
jgi:hypothetical protein